MSELMPYRPRAELAVPAASDTDSWTEILRDVAELASQIASTPFVPDGLRGSAPAVAAAILSGRELGLGPMTSLANIHVIKGKPALSAALMRALILAQGHQIETVDISDTRAKVRGRRRGEAEWEEASFTADQAKQAGISLGGYPQDKLYARATSRLARRKFADVIAGMPYSAEELEDGTEPVRPEDMTDKELDAAYAKVTERPRTAQRAKRPQSPPPAQAATPAADGPQRAGGDLPPLPGEEDAPGPIAAGPGAPDTTDYDTPGTATRGKGGQLTALWTVMSTEFGFTSTEESKAQARLVCEHIINRDLVGGTTGDLSRNEAKTVLDTLAHWQHQAAKEGREPRDYMLAVMVAGDTAPRGEDGQEGDRG